MSKPSIQLRPARPERKEGLLFARYLDEAAEGFFRFWLGPDSAEILAHAFTRPGHDLSYEHVTFAVRGDQTLGMTCCYTAEQHSQSSDRPLREAPGFRPARASIIAVILRPIMRILDDMEDGDFYLQAIAVDEECRGAGLGSLLMGLVEARARDVGATRLCLDVSSGNTGGRRLYERLGMTIVKQSPKLFFAPKFRLLRMAKTL